MTTKGPTIQTNASIPLEIVPVGASTSSTPVVEVSNDHISSTPPATSHQPLSMMRTSTIYLSLSGTQFISSLSSGLIAIALPRMASDLSIPTALLLWPTAIYSLISGCSLLPAGAVSDVVGSRNIYLIGTLLMCLTLLFSGLSRTSDQLLAARALQGLAVSLCLPAGVALMTDAFAEGKARNLGFALQGMAQPLGFSAGLFLGGFFVDSIGWRWGWYLDAIATALVGVLAVWCLPRKEGDEWRMMQWKKLKTDVDWVGAALASASLGGLSYVLATVAATGSSIRQPTSIVLLCVSAASAVGFVYWMKYQVKRGKPALIPNYLWQKKAFSVICIMVFLAVGVLNTFEYNFSLYVQEVQELPAIQASLRFIPNIVVGVILMPVWGAYLHKIPAYYLVLVPFIVTLAAHVLMAIANPAWSYWYAAFWAMTLSPLAGDVLFVVATVLTTSIFPAHMQSLAGAVFNTVAQFGQAFGLSIMAVISAQVTQKSSYAIKTSPDALLAGYRASYWACFGATVLGCAVGGWGLRGIGIVGMKRD